jgi:hypothetical protein
MSHVVAWEDIVEVVIRQSAIEPLARIARELLDFPRGARSIYGIIRKVISIK